MTVELRAKFFGQVQGVFFRATARDIALRLKLVGTVCNLADGSVELFAQGEREVLDQLLEEINSRYDCSSEVKFYSPGAVFEGFRVIYHE